MRTYSKFLLVPAVAALVNCNQPDTTGPDAGPSQASQKAPLKFDETPLLYPTIIGKGKPALGKAASTYYTFWAPSQIDWSDCNYQKLGMSGEYNCGTNYGYQINHAEATYSSRVAANPALMWQPVSGIKGLQNMVLLDNEQAESHLFPTRVPQYSRQPPYNQIGWYPIKVDLDYKVSSEANYDFLWINSTAANGSCNSPGVVHKMVSGIDSGHVSFTIPGECENPWIGIYYIKDYSVSSNGDYARIKNVSIWPMIPVGG